MVHCYGVMSSVKEKGEEVPSFWIVLELLDSTLIIEIKNPQSLQHIGEDGEDGEQSNLRAGGRRRLVSPPSPDSAQGPKDGQGDAHCRSPSKNNRHGDVQGETRSQCGIGDQGHVEPSACWV